MKKAFLVAVAALAFLLPAHAQSAPAPAPAPPSLPGYNISISAGYTSTSGNQTNNGIWGSLAVPVYAFSGAFGKAWDASLAARADYFTLATPQDYVVTVGPEFRFQFSKPTVLNGAVFQPFANFGLGAARQQCVSSNSCVAGSDLGSHFTGKIGGGIDVPVSSSITLRVVELDYLHSSAFPKGGIFVSNLSQLSTGLSIRF